jgi:rubrerythrin
MFVFGTADDVFAMAIRIKENGKAFYEHAALMGDDPVVKKLFADLAILEDCHIQCFKALRSQLPEYFPEEKVWDPENLAKSYLEAAADTHVFTEDVAKERMKKVQTPMEALDMALQFEKDSVHFFLGIKEMIPDQEAKSELNRLIGEEMDHVRRLAEARKRCRPTECDINP